MQQTQLKAVIFDLDGVIVSTDDQHFEAWSKIAEDEGIYFDREINNRLRGVSRMESLDILLERSDNTYSLEQKNELAQRKNEHYKVLIKSLTPADILPGVKDLIAGLRAVGIRTAIGSSSKNAESILESIGLHDDFDVVVSGIDISRSKPDPEVFILAANRLGVVPGECIVIEDARSGIDAAIAGGMKTIGVGDAASYDRANLARDALDQISVEDLKSLANVQ